MKDIYSILQTLRRPRLLIRAARIGVQDYRREPHLSRILGAVGVPRTAAALVRLIEIEAELDTQRVAKSAGYSIARHVDVLVAMMGEAQLLRAARSEA